MQRPPPHAPGAVAAFCLVAAAPAAAQQPTAGGPELSLAARTLTSALLALVVAGGLVALVPNYVERTTDRILDAPGETFVYGIVIGIVGGIVAVVLVFTVIGILVAVPIIIALGVVGYLGFLAVGRAASDSRGTVLAVAVTAAAVTGGIPVLGGLVGLVLSSMGIGAAYLDYRDDGQRRSRGGRRSGAAGGTGHAADRTGSRNRKRQSGPPSPPGTDARGDDSAEGDGDDPGSPRRVGSSLERRPGRAESHKM